jgi:hypothetical protein
MGYPPALPEQAIKVAKPPTQRAITAEPPVARTSGVCPCCHNLLCDSIHRSATSKAGVHHSPFERLLSDDVLSAIAMACGRDLPAFACVSQSVRRVVQREDNGGMWRRSYLASCGDQEEDDDFAEDSMPESMWRACLVQRAERVRSGLQATPARRLLTPKTPGSE